MNLFKKKLSLNRSVETFFDTHFIPLQNEPSPILIVQNLGRSSLLSAGKHHFSGEQLYYRKMNQ